MKLIITFLVICLLIEAGFFMIRDAVSSSVSLFDRFAEIALFLMFVLLFFYSRYPRLSMLLCAFCAVAIGLNIESHKADHSLSDILARNLVMIIFFIIGALGFPKREEDIARDLP